MKRIYSEKFAQAYNIRWTNFARRTAPVVLDYYESVAGDEEIQILDLGCGTGQFAEEALNRGHQIIGIDSSPYMLGYARKNNQAHIQSGRAAFFIGDIRCFEVEVQSDLAVATYDVFNHLSDKKELLKSFLCIHRSVKKAGRFVFDLNTRLKLENWTGVHITDTKELALIERAVWVADESKAYIKLSGFLLTSNGSYDRFEELTVERAFKAKDVYDLLMESGWRKVHIARAPYLNIPISDPEREERIFFVAEK